MADFNVGLSAPQGSGARPVEPVQTGSALSGTENLFSMLGKGFMNLKKQEEQQAQLAVIQEYSKKMGAISDSISAGSFNSSRGATEIRKLTNQFAAQYPQYVDELKKIHTFFVTGTEGGKAIEQESDENKRRGELLTAAGKAGFPLFRGMAPEAEDVIVQAYQNQERARQLFQEQRQLAEETRAQSRFDKEVVDDHTKRTSVTLLTEIAKSQTTSFQAFAQELGKKVRAGGMNPEEAKMMLDKQMAQLRIGIDAVSGRFPELAAPQRQLLEEIYKAGADYIDPAKDAKLAKDAFDAYMNKAKLATVSADPKIRNLAVSTSLFGPSPSLTLAGEQIVQKVLNMSSADSSDKLPVLGTDDEKQVIGHLKEAVKGLMRNPTADQKKAFEEGSNSVNFLLKEVGKQMNTGEYNSNSLGEVAKFLASPEYLHLSKNGQISKEAAQAAKGVFQKGLYEPLAQQAADKLSTALSSGLQISYQSKGRGNSTKVTKYEPWQIKDMVDIKFDGSNISFTPKNTQALDESDQRALRQQFNELKGVATSMTALIKSASHLAQTDDYVGTFEKMKHIFFPYYYSQYENLEIGDTKKGPDGKLYRYAGGDASNGNNWKPTGN